MQLLQSLLIHGLDRRVLGRQKDYFVALTTQPSGVMVRRSTGLHDDPAGGAVGKEAIETSSAQALPLDNMPALIGQGDLEDIFCQVYTDSRSIRE